MEKRRFVSTLLKGNLVDRKPGYRKKGDLYQ